MTIKYQTIIALLFIMALHSCILEPTKTQPQYKNYASEISQSLEQAYSNNSTEQLEDFFQIWRENLPGYSLREIKAFSEPVQHCYDIFNIFYQPINYSQITGGEYGSIDPQFNYLVLQNRLDVAITDTNPEYYYYRNVETQYFEITDFRPQIEIENFPYVYLTHTEDSVIFHYLLEEDSTVRDDLSARMEFLEAGMQLTPHHWIPDYHKLTMPVAERIILNEEMTQAMVFYRLFYRFGEVHLENKNGTWQITSSELTMIE